MEKPENTKSVDEKQKGERRTKKKGSREKRKSEPTLKEVRQEAVAAMCPEVRAIAEGLAALAKEGNCQAAKLVFEFLGIFPPPAEEDDGDDSLARYLLRQLGINDHPSEEEITKVLDGDKEANADAVESS
jgi:hypothetical protein